MENKLTTMGVKNVEKAVDYFMAHYNGKYYRALYERIMFDDDHDESYINFYMMKVDLDRADVVNILSEGKDDIPLSKAVPVLHACINEHDDIDRFNETKFFDSLPVCDFYNPYIDIAEYYNMPNDLNKNPIDEKHPLPDNITVISEDEYNKFRKMQDEYHKAFEVMSDVIDAFNELRPDYDE